MGDLKKSTPTKKKTKKKNQLSSHGFVGVSSNIRCLIVTQEFGNIFVLFLLSLFEPAFFFFLISYP